MPLYMIERNFAEQLDLGAMDVSAMRAIHGDCGVNWLFSFLTADKRKTYCLFEANNADAVFEAARLAQVPADAVVEVSQAFGEQIRAVNA